MTNFLGDPGKYDVWKFMNIKDVLNFCMVDTSAYQICNDPYTWKFLIYRDFNIDIIDDSYSIDDLKRVYFVEYIKNKTYEYNFRHLLEFYRLYGSISSLLPKLYDLDDQLMIHEITKEEYNKEIDILRTLFAETMYDNKIIL